MAFDPKHNSRTITDGRDRATAHRESSMIAA